MDQEVPSASVLLVDDEPLHLDLLEASLRGLRLRLVKAHSGAEALQRLEEKDFALILLDIVMPGMNGFETAARIRQLRRSKDTPIIFLTAHLKAPDKVLAGYRAGAVDYLIKPVDAYALRAKATVFARLFELADELRRDNTCLETSHRELQQAVMQIGTLREALCICERCKNLLDSSGRWTPPEEYLHARLGADVCLGVLCPDCAGAKQKSRVSALEA
ncbi:MAG: response regulator [Verrucomicrobiae bacterium]|nr:response regulator [Verrucomicrobiae bacterium]